MAIQTTTKAEGGVDAAAFDERGMTSGFDCGVKNEKKHCRF